MEFFPFYIDIKNKKCIIVGGGSVALRKLEKLIPFSPEITVIAPEVRNEILDFSKIKIVKRKFQDKDIENAFLVISASDNVELNAHIFELCSEKKILVNTVDDLQKCGFVFPSIVKKNNLTIGITTSGKSPLYARYIGEKIEDLVDAESSEIIEILSKFRPVIKKEIESVQVRKMAFKQILRMYTENDRIPEERQIYEMIEDFKKYYEN